MAALELTALAAAAAIAFLLLEMADSRLEAERVTVGIAFTLLLLPPLFN